MVGFYLRDRSTVVTLFRNEHLRTVCVCMYVLDFIKIKYGHEGKVNYVQRIATKPAHLIHSSRQPHHLHRRRLKPRYTFYGRHWLYHWFDALHVPDAHVVGPVYPWPPHCP